MKRFLLNEERPGRVWALRIGSMLAAIALVGTAGYFFTKAYAQKDTNLVWPAVLLILIAPPLGWIISWMWKDSIFTPFQWARARIEGAEGGHRHEWYAYRGQRVRVFFDEARNPWFAANDIAGILELDRSAGPFRHYGQREYAEPDSAGEPCLSEPGLRRLIKYSKHPDAPGLGPWLEREVLLVIARRRERLGDET